MQREYAKDATDEPWPTFMVQNKHCPIDTEKDAIYIPNVRHRVPYINIPEKPTMSGKETYKNQEKHKQAEKKVDRDVLSSVDDSPRWSGNGGWTLTSTTLFDDKE